ncbi:MAG: S41 family peptidase [Urechidicola sp.]|nr:S41 family peptidase [Urechidicola sp.]
MKKYIYISAFLLTLLSSCEKAFMEPNPETDNIAIFEEYWKLVDEKFAMFSDPGKEINRDLLYSENRALISNTISTDSLFNVLGSITEKLKDGHSYIVNYDQDKYIGFDHTIGFLRNLNQSIVDNVYLNNNVQLQGDGLKYTLLDNGNVGYIQYRDFENEVTTDMMNSILTSFENTNGIILDVRGNSGGDPTYAALMASHFTNSSVYIGYENFKTGPAIDDFSRSEIYLNPTSGKKYLKPLIVLTNIECFSATTTLIYHLNPLSNVTFMGATTGGGSGSTADGFLANGWLWGLSTSEFIDWEGRRLDNGFEPDINVLLDENDITKDEIIERAILELQ